MCCHKAYDFLPPLFTPILCGADFSEPVDGAVPDNSGINISARNREYCELTAHYYAWKNVSAERYGFCHYRRFFCADENIRKPYLACGGIPGESLLGSESFWLELIGRYEIIVPRGENMGLPVREHYCTSKYHYAEDLSLFIGILKETAPRLSQTADEYLAQERQYFCNMFIMDKAHFFEYCSILFPALEEFDRRKTLHGSFQADRTDGYLGEIFTGIYINYCRKNVASIKELPRLDMNCSFGKRFTCALLPPESRRRFLTKKLVKKSRR